MLTTTLDVARIYSWVAQCDHPCDGGRTKTTKLEDFEMDVMFKMIPTYITEVDKVDISVTASNS